MNRLKGEIWADSHFAFSVATTASFCFPSAGVEVAGVWATGAGGPKATVLVLGAFSAVILGVDADEVTVSVAMVAVDTADVVEAACAAAIVALFTASNTLSSTRSSKSRVSTA